MITILKQTTALCIIALALCLQACTSGKAKETTTELAKKVYVCVPCGYACDTTVHAQPGTCTVCKMELVEKSTVRHQQVAPKDLCGYIAGKGDTNIVILDVRTPEEFNGTAADKFGRLKNAINIPVQQLDKRVNELKKYSGKEIIVYCSHSHRSPRACYALTQNGFKNVTNLQGGMSTWQSNVMDEDCNSQLYIKQ
jgi:rhodanese-related sulfurtransferase